MVVATLDGSVGYLLPLPETTFRRLKMLQIKLVQGLPHNAGLNPKAFRYIIHSGLICKLTHEYCVCAHVC